MGRAINSNALRLTDTKIARLTTPGLFAVGGNLYVNVTASGGKQWIFRYRGRDGKRHDMGFGSTGLVTLDQARQAALNCRKLRAQGGDPLAHRRLTLAAQRVALAKRTLLGSASTATLRRTQRNGRKPTPSAGGRRSRPMPSRPWASCRWMRSTISWY